MKGKAKFINEATYRIDTGRTITFFEDDEVEVLSTYWISDGDEMIEMAVIKKVGSMHFGVEVRDLEIKDKRWDTH